MSECGNIISGPWYDSFLQTGVDEGIPLFGTFELTPRCSFNCEMCYVHLNQKQMDASGKELSADEWIRLGREAAQAGTICLCITGGEPLLHPEFKRIYTELSQMGFFITLQTNAYLIDEEIIDLLKEYPPHLVKTTVYGSDNGVYEKVCKVKDGFTRVDKGIRAVIDAGINVQLVTTVIKNNLHDLPDIHRYADKLGVSWGYSAAAYPSVRNGNQTEGIALTESDTGMNERMREKKVSNPVFWREKNPCEVCKGYRNSYWILWDGNMRFCSFMNEPNIKVAGRPFICSWNELLDFEMFLRWPRECLECEVKDVCSDCIGVINSYSSSIYTVNKKRCDIIKRYFS